MLGTSFKKVIVPSLFSLLFAAFSAGCGDGNPGTGGSGGSGGDGGSGGGGGDAAAAYDAMIQAACEKQVSCGYPILNQGKTVDACVSLQKTAAGEIPTSMGGGAVVLREDRLKACAAAITEASCQAVAANGIDIDAACTTYWEGTLGEGEACRGGVASDCQAGLVCQFEGQKCPGTCVAPEPPCVEGSCEEGSYCDSEARCAPRVAVGQACGWTVEGALHENPCEAGAFCLYDTCAAQIAEGEACTGSYERECAAGFTCLCTDEGCAEHVCAAAPKLGEACDMSSMCDGAGLFCNFDTGKCDERRAEDEACPDSYGACQPGLVCAGGACKKPADVPAPDKPLVEAGGDCTKGGVCPLGETCLCDAPKCKTGKKSCQAGPALGESCEEALQLDFTPFVCSEGLCDVLGSNTCVAQKPAGAPCTGVLTFECGSGVCDNGKCASIEETRCK